MNNDLQNLNGINNGVNNATPQGINNTEVSPSPMASTSDVVDAASTNYTGNQNVMGQDLNSVNNGVNNTMSQGINNTEVPQNPTVSTPEVMNAGSTNYTGNQNVMGQDLNSINNAMPQGINNPDVSLNSTVSTSGTMDAGTMNYAGSQNVVGQDLSDANTSSSFNNQSMMNGGVPPYQSNSNTFASNTDEELLKAFIGKNYDKITTNKFNFAGFFFTSLYMIYRKMILFGILTFIIQLIINNLIGNFIVTIICGVIIGFVVNKIYLFYAKRKIEKIKISNPGDILNTCVKKGGTSVPLVIGTFILELIVIIIVLIFTLGASIFSGILSLFGDAEFNLTGTYTSVYEGSLSYNTSITISDEVYVSVPSVFEEGIFNDEHEYNYEYNSGEGIFDTCDFSIAVVNFSSTAQDLIEQMEDYFDDEVISSLSTKTINGTTWYTIATENSIGQTYYYAASNNNKIYLVEYEIQEDADTYCSSYQTQVINSLKLK